jgi:glycine hydroxymethyltransferase
MKEAEMRRIGFWIARILKDIHNEAVIRDVHAEVTMMAGKFTLHPE